MAENTTPPAKAAPANGQVRASSDAHTSKADQAEDALAQVEKEMFPTDADSVISQVDRETLRPEYTILDVDPNDLVLCQASKRDDVLLSAVAASLDAMGIIIPPMAVRLPDKNLQVLLGQGRTRVCWAQDRGVSQIRVVEIQLNGVPLWMIMREVAIEDLRRDLSYMRFIGWCDELEVHMKTIHSRQGARRKLIADQRRSQTMLAKKSGLPTDRHKVDANRSERWQDRKFGDPIQESKNDDTLATSMRFKYPLTVSLFFRRAMSESTARRVLKFREALRSEEPTICNYDMNKRLSGLAEGEYSADGIERKLRSLERVEQVKKKIREHSALTAKDIEVVIRWMFARIKCQNLWIWDAVNPCFGILRRLAQLQDHTRKQFGLTDEEAKSFVRGEYPGADVPLNLMAYLTRPGDLVVDFFAGSGAARDAAEHFLDPFWPDGTGRSVWWNSWSEAFRSDPKSRALRESIFPRDYWEVSHHRKCLQFDLEPNALGAIAKPCM